MVKLAQRHPGSSCTSARTVQLEDGAEHDCCFFFGGHVETRRSQSAQSARKKKRLWQVSASEQKLRSTVIGGSTTNFTADLIPNPNKKLTPLIQRNAGAVGIRSPHSFAHLDLHKKVRAK